MERVVEQFIARWSKATGTELANAQLFVSELCRLLDVETPQPASNDTRDNAYVFERRVIFKNGDGTTSEGRIDCYQRGRFVLESKKVKEAISVKGAKAFDDRMQRARGQAEAYARALPAHEGRPPFLVVVDVGNVIELYAEFSQTGGTYTPFPDARSHRIRLLELADEHIRTRLRNVWLDPLGLDPARATAEVTREVADRLALVAKALEQAGHDAEIVAGFLTRCLFSMFAEDVGLLPKRSFANLLEELAEHPERFVPMLTDVWRAMDKGEFSVALKETLLKFNGKLFKPSSVLPMVLPLAREHIDLLRQAAVKNWKLVEPAIFGTLLERALNPIERHALGAHYTPRAYVERLVIPTIIEPLRTDWQDTKAAALVLAAEAKLPEAQALVRSFHRELCNIRVLDPACGSGNFLYVTLEHMKRLEGEVLVQLEELGDTQGLLVGEGLTVDPHQFLGIELNPRAAAIAELVLWIGYLQWHFRTHGSAMPPQPVLKDFANIECRDAVLAYDRVEYVMDETGKAVTRWDGRSLKTHPVTGEQVPDERATTALERYVNPRQAKWPQANFIVGNPPFIGPAAMRQALGDGYTEALRKVWKQVPDSADFVMYWWNHAAATVRAAETRRFGFITTNSLRQTFNRRVLEQHLAPHEGEGKTKPALSLSFAIPDHPWVDSASGAAVRIAMTVGRISDAPGELLTIATEVDGETEEAVVTFKKVNGRINVDLTMGADVSSAVRLNANDFISSPGMKLHGAGFIITQSEAIKLGLGTVKRVEQYIRAYRNGRDLTDTPRGVMVIDLFGLTLEEVRKGFPLLYQRVHGLVKPERDQNNRATYRNNWWIFGEPRREMRPALAGLPRYIATVETAKHRTFQFLDASILPDNMLIAIALSDAYELGVLSSSAHVTWTLASGGTLEDRPRYNKTRCFETFPFPDASATQTTRIRNIAEQLDAHRKRQQAAHTEVTLTGMYNVLEKLKSGGPLTAKERVIHDSGLVAVLKSLHDELDVEVLRAYGWDDLVPLMNTVNNVDGTADAPTREAAKADLNAQLLERLVALNQARAAEEATGTIRWLRPAYQVAGALGADAKTTATAQATLDVDTAQPLPDAEAADVEATTGRTPWPSELAQQVRAVSSVLAKATQPLSVEDIAAQFTGRGAWKKRLPSLLETLEALGRARCDEQRSGEQRGHRWTAS